MEKYEFIIDGWYIEVYVNVNKEDVFEIQDALMGMGFDVNEYTPISKRKFINHRLKAAIVIM